MFWSVANAQAGSAVAQPGLLETVVVPFAVLFGVLYFLVLRPQAKRQRDQANFNSALKRGDQVLTASGILGTIEGLTEKYVTLEIANGVKIKMLRQQIAGPAEEVQK